MVERTGGRLSEEKIEMKQLIFISEFNEGEKCYREAQKGGGWIIKMAEPSPIHHHGQHLDEGAFYGLHHRFLRIIHVLILSWWVLGRC